jgi:hypothetical protein
MSKRGGDRASAPERVFDTADEAERAAGTDSAAEKNEANMVEWFRENWIALLALILSIPAIIFTYCQYRLSRSLAHLHIEPTIKTYFDAPAEKNPIFALSNEGNVPAASVSVVVRLYVYNKNKKAIVSTASMGEIFSPGAIYREELKPTEHVSLELIGVKPKSNLIVAYQFSIRYFRKSNMREFSRVEYSFVDAGVPVAHADFLSSEHYRHLMSEIPSVEVPLPKWDRGSLREYFDATEGAQ